ncbi:hypothetical protein PHISP_01890 [Aspergillus sp. HF37]|nr:hypothetical protein PHISP_01890 [Aspergillus sp. HF37]
MRRPGIVTWDSEMVYECVWSLLCQVEEQNRGRYADWIDSVLVTPLATGNGCVSKERWAAQFVLALKHFVDALECPKRSSQLGWREIGSDAREVEMTWGDVRCLSFGPLSNEYCRGGYLVLGFVNTNQCNLLSIVLVIMSLAVAIFAIKYYSTF